MASSPRTASPPQLPRRGRKADDPRLIGPWKVGRTLGKGSSGRVKIARHSKTGKYAAIKIVSKIHLVNSRRSLHDLGVEADRILLSIEREIVIMKLINHPNIMRLYDVWETTGELYMILEYIEGGELFDYIVEKGRLPAAEALDYFQQLISAMDYCHRFNIAHRDLKPENLLLDKDKNLKVADFGMAAWQKSDTDLLETSCGSPHYAAPEVVRGDRYDGTAADIWSCGVILFALLAGKLPFDDENIETLLNKVRIGKFSFPSDFHPGAKDLISKMLQVDIKKRIDFAGIITHPWYTSRPMRRTICPPPSIDELAKPIGSAFEIDADIFGNLKTLWNGAPDEDIMKALTDDKQTWEKVVYHLLMKYRNTHLEDIDYKSRSRKSKRSEKVKDREDDDRRSPPPRPDPPTPRKAWKHSSPPANGPLKEAEEDSLASPCIAEPKQTSNSPHEAQPLPSMAKSTHKTTHSPNPTSNLSPASLLSPNSPLSPSSPIWEALDMQPVEVPDIQDENVQIFFQQIVDHLNAMQQKPPGTSPLTILPSPLNSPRNNDNGITNPLNFVRRLTPNTSMSPPSPNGPNTRGQPGILSSAVDSFGLGILSSPPLEQGSTKIRRLIKKSSLRNRGNNQVDRHVKILEPPKIVRERAEEASPKSPTISDDSSNISTSSQRRSWFGNLFKFKPVVFELFSMQDAVSSREECMRLLMSFGVRVVLTQAEGPGQLKCFLEEVRDAAGVTTVVKGVAFRVEMRPILDEELIEAGYLTALDVVQEKGALQSFKMIYNRLRHEWVLDCQAPTPIVLPSPVPDINNNGRFLEVPSFDV